MSRRRLVPCVVFVVAILAFHMVSLGRYPSIGQDEVYFAATGYSLATRGTFARYIHPGPAGFEQRDYFPPIIPLILAASYSIFGFGVWQTKFPLLLLGILSAYLFFYLTKRLTGNTMAAVLATLVFALNRETIYSWQSGRFEVVSIFLLLLTLIVGHLSVDNTGAKLALSWGVIGTLAALQCLSYYPFSPIAVFTTLVLSWYLLWGRQRLTLPEKKASVVALLLGFSIVMIPFTCYVLQRPDLFWRQIVAQISNYSQTNAVGFLGNILHEPKRYLIYATKRAGVFEVLLGIVVLFLFPSATKGSQGQNPDNLGIWKVVWLNLLFVGAFLAIYSMKQEVYLVYIAPPMGILVAFIYTRFLEGGMNTRLKSYFLSLIYVSIGIAVLNVGVAAYTLARQWQGRDYALYIATLRSLIPAHVAVVGPLVAWYPLAPTETALRIYTQGGKQVEEPTGTLQLNDPEQLRNVSYIILQPAKNMGDRLPGLCAYARKHFVLVKQLRLPFHSLPWSQSSPYDMDVYKRRSADSPR